MGINVTGFWQPDIIPKVYILDQLCYGSDAAQLVASSALKFPPSGLCRLAQK